VVVAQARIVGPVHAFARDLEDARVHLAHGPDEPPHLVPRGHAAGHGPPVRVSWLGEREVVKPMAPAAMLRAAPLHGGQIVLGAGFSKARSPMT